MYGEEYEHGRNLQLIDTTNKRLVETSGYFIHPDRIDKSPIKTNQNLKIAGIIL